MNAENIAAHVETQGYAFVPAQEMRLLMPSAVLSGWNGFAKSWNDLAQDGYMADGGRYRSRRHAAFALSDDIKRLPPQPHYQSLAHNSLNGGIKRWFEPVSKEIAEGAINTALLNLCRTVFNMASRNGRTSSYKVEMHQFRIEPGAGGAGKPTPEGIHRDGVDWACVLLVDRQNVDQGITGIYTPDKVGLAEFTLASPMDCMFLDDRRVLHGVTPVNLADSSRKGRRDALVLTFTAMP